MRRPEGRRQVRMQEAGEGGQGQGPGRREGDEEVVSRQATGMRAAMQGPILGSALVRFEDVRASSPRIAARRTCLTPDSAIPTPEVHPRRQIGIGARAIIVTNPAQTRTRRRATVPTMKRGRNMKRTTLIATITGAFLVSAAALGISAAVDAPRSLMSPLDYGASKR